jgi:hypothetical protein
MKNKRTSPKPSFKVEIVYADHAAQHSFGLLADLLLEEIVRKRKELAANSSANQTSRLNEKITHPLKE